MSCELRTNHRVSQWYAFFLMVISALILIAILAKAVLRLREMFQFRYRALSRFDDSDSRYSGVD